MKIWMILWTFSLLLSGCKAKVYLLPGELDTGGVNDQCSSLPQLPQILDTRLKINRLVRDSLREEDPETLTAIAAEVSKYTVLLNSISEPQFTDSKYPVTYTFKIGNEFLGPNLHPYFEKFSIFGNYFPFYDIEMKSTLDAFEIMIPRKASLFEICALSGTVQGLFSVGAMSNEPTFYYRLYVDKVK